MGTLVAVTGIVLLVLNGRALILDGEWTMSILSTASALFVTALGFALTVQPLEENV